MLRRREALTLFGAGTGLFVAGLSKQLGLLQMQESNPITLPACVVRPEQTEGPYFVDDRLNRSDIRLDSTNHLVKGALLQLKFRLSQISGNACLPVSGAMVDIWHCDAEGVYSDVLDPNFNTVGKKFLRGYQVTHSDGTVQFTTIYPGWYSGRTTHIHFKVRTNTRSEQNYEFTSQLYFDDSLTDYVYTQPPYARKGERQVRNSGDDIFRTGGDQLLLAVAETDQGYAATLELGFQMD